MTVKYLRHKFSSAIADGTDATLVRPSNWNDDHDFWLGFRTVTSGTDTVANTDHLSLVVYNNAAGIAVSLPVPTTGPPATFPLGWRATLRNATTGNVTITPASTINGSATPIVLSQNDALNLYGTGTSDFNGIVTHGGGAGIVISDTPPVSPINGMLWWESDTGLLWIYYTDPNTSQWIAVNGAPSAPSAVGVVQHAYAENTVYTQSTAVMAGALDSVPQQTDGTQILSVSITPKSASSKLRIHVSIPTIVAGGSLSVWAAVFQDSTAAAITSGFIQVSANQPQSMSLTYEMSAGSITSTTFKVRVGLFTSTSGTISMNGSSGGRWLGGSNRMTITVDEFAT
jgi:hypothetical protein